VSYVIAAPCVDHTDQSCVAVCPVDAIYGDLAVDRKLYVDPQGCIECGACETACPNAAIVPEGKLPAAWRAWATVDATWFDDPELARREVDRLAGAA
jgi:ferredoxin